MTQIVITFLSHSSVTGLTQPNFQAPLERYNDSDPRWFIGAGRISPDHVVLIGVVQVSRGSWMPILQLNHFLV
jgi:hypothetical protein